MALDLATFRARFPEFSGVPDPVAQLQIDDAILDVSETVFGDRTDLVVAFLAAHRLASSYDSVGNATGGSSSMVVSSSVDGVQATFLVPDGMSALDSMLWSTSYGQRYIELRNRFTSGPVVVG